MKHMRKVFALALTLIMALALTVPAFAVRDSDSDDSVNAGDTVTGKITIENPVSTETYDLYRIFDLESYNATTNAYAYKVNTKWEAFAQSVAAQEYVSVDAQGYVTWIKKNGDNAIGAQDFAKLALQYAKDNHIAAVATGKTTYTDLPLGYYLIDSSLGSLCTLDTTNNNITVKEKNSVPSVVKLVQEDSKIGKADEWGASNTADIGQTVEFKSTITIPASVATDASTGKAGVVNLVLHDDMDEVLDFQNDVKVYLNGSTTPLTEGADKDYTVKTEGLSDGCTFEVRFTESFLNSLDATEDTIVVTYSAKVSTDAEAHTEYKNITNVSYGENNTIVDSAKDETITKTYDFKVKKVTVDETELTGAEFTLSKNANGSDPISFVAVTGGYRVATSDDVDADKTTTLAAGFITITGLDADTYYLTETKAPDGYNILAAPVYVEIKEDGVVMIENPAYDAQNPDAAQQYIVANDDLVAVVNSTGSLLPSTGGIGTTIFYMVGGILMAGAAILLITKKKMSNEQ